MLRKEVAKTLERMPAGSHAALVYDSQQNKRDILFNHLKFGSDKEGLIYVCTEETPDQIRKGMEGFGIDAGRLMADGLLSIKNYDEVYFEDGSVDASRIVSKFSDAAWDYRSRGLTGLRGAAEMSCFFREGKVRELLQYEKALHSTFAFPGKGICAYNLVDMGNSGNLDLLWPVIKSHGLVIMTGPSGGFALESTRVTEEDMEAARATIPR